MEELHQLLRQHGGEDVLEMEVSCRAFLHCKQTCGANYGTLPETNIAPENGWLEYYFPIGKAHFQGSC